MFSKHLVLTGIILSIIFLVISASFYPGGSQHDINATGYSWQHNYFSNLFAEKAMNGMINQARPWAAAGMLFLCISVGIFFITYAKKIPNRSASNVIRFCGAGAMISTFLAVTPYHDMIIPISSFLALICIFYITVFLFMSRLHFFKFLSVLLLLVAYTSNYMYFSRTSIEFLPIMQKLTVLIKIAWVLGLHYFTSADDFLKNTNIKTESSNT